MQYANKVSNIICIRQILFIVDEYHCEHGEQYHCMRWHCMQRMLGSPKAEHCITTFLLVPQHGILRFVVPTLTT